MENYEVDLDLVVDLVDLVALVPWQDCLQFIAIMICQSPRIT